MVACHGEFCQFISDYEICQIVLVRELISESEPVIEQPEPEYHPPVT